MSQRELELRQYRSLIEGERDEIAVLANTSAFLQEHLSNINWVGFYLVKGEEELVLGPFQGRSACYRIPFSKGVCGWASRNQKSIVVKDVHEFEGHIACDERSQSEMVIPIFRAGKLYGVLDVDSPEKANFDIMDQIYAEEIVKILEEELFLK